MAKKKPDQDKSIGRAETKLDLRSQATDQASLERNADLNENPGDGSHKTSVCYNAGCADYRVERKGDAPCACKRPAVDRR